MIFPLDVQKRAEDANRMVGENKKQLIVTIFVLANFFGFFALRIVMQSIGLPTKYGIWIQIALMIVIGIFVFRFAIFHEDEKKQEYKSKDSDSFARFMDLRKDSVREYEQGNIKLHAFEFINGNVTCTLELKFGGNDPIKAANTRKCYKDILHAIAMAGFEHRITIMSENFGDSVEFKKYIQRLNGIKDVNLRYSNMAVAEEALKQANDEGNVEVVYLSVSSRQSYKIEELNILLRDIIGIIGSSSSAFRSVYSLNAIELMEFYRYFYGIEAIDLSMMKAIDLANELQDEFVNVVEAVILKGTSGKVYSNMKDIENIFSIKERKLG